MQYKGISAQSGQAEGKLCIVHDPNDFAHCTSEHIVLLDKVKPNAVLASRVKAILAVHGGITSHAAIVARESNKPAIVGLPESMLEEVKNDMVVKINAGESEGNVEINN